MSNSWFDAYTCIMGASLDSEHAFFVLKDIGLEESELAHSIFVEYDSGRWREIEMTNWESAGICAFDGQSPSMLAIGQTGALAYADLGGLLVTDDIAPAAFRLRHAATVGTEVFACGMRREVYQRLATNAWRQIFSPLAEKGELAGFECISGFSPSDLYVVGWNGEIWNCISGNWHRIDSPTNQILTGVLCSSSGEVLVCGRSGTLIRGRGDIWEIIDTAAFIDDFWSIAEFDGNVYLSTMKDVFQLKDDLLVPAAWGETRPETCYQLTSSKNALWSIGPNDIWLYNGSSWKTVL